MLDQLSQRLQGVFSGLGGSGKKLTEDDIDTAMREVRRALLEADVNLRVVKSFVANVKEKALGQQILKTLQPQHQLVSIVHDELVALLGAENKPLLLSGTPSVIVLFGLQGSGKTTTAGKLALHLRKQNKKPLLVAADTYRPAAIQQLIQLGKQVDIPVHSLEGSTDMLAIAQSGLARAQADGHDVVIIDTAGRLQVDTELMAELLLLERAIQPQEKLLVIDAMMGQEAVGVAEAFHSQMRTTGLVITKLDGDARGGAVLSVVEATGQPIKLIGTSEKLDGLEPFHPERMATRILGMGDVLTLVEKAQAAFDQQEAEAMAQKMRKASFTLEDFMKLQKQLKMLGSLDQVLGMLPIPGLTQEMRETVAHGGEKQLKRIEAMVQSMTPAERREPELINPSRQQRIAQGCGMPESEVAQFLKQFFMMRDMMKQMTKMGDKMSGHSQPSANTGGLSMPRSARKKKPKNPFGPGGFPGGMPPGGPGAVPGLPPGLPFGKGRGGFPFG